MSKQIMICGIDCHQGDQNCNGYCTGDSQHPPEATPQMKLEAAKEKAHRLLNEAEQAWHAYAAQLDVGPERERAFEVYQNVRLARRV
ncbi:hypothetical protein PVT67_15645 [Gallaecimonas kandeliae]|uniref:hypothetical protein n=1 Tax=Gallaecimonas kandeliae TaxID=3029055 RepID=UPI00264A18FC|nr:hypothetical protein [Gallaecimonas kandeliae]WKE65076.1 hypothetical protein PVT67_15645 [Gallaecimonas kandeliae]